MDIYFLVAKGHGVNMTNENDSNINIEGTFDMTNTWKSIGQKKGKTVDSVDDEENGNEEHSFWPEEIEDPSEMTELQRETVRRAVMNPSLDSNEIGEKIGKQGGYVRATLHRCCPEWYDEVFKPTGRAGWGEGTYETSPFLDRAARECNKCGEQIILHEKINDEILLRCRCHTIHVKALLPTSWLRDFNE